MAPIRRSSSLGRLQLLLTLAHAHARRVSISNVAPLFDTDGNRVNAHDGSLIVVDGAFYLFGTVYLPCKQAHPVCDDECGYFGNLFAAYTSPDLSNRSWTKLSSNLLPALAVDNENVSYWEANVQYNHATKRWVMVYWSGHYGFKSNLVALATSDSPAGPFVNAPPLEARNGTIISDTVALWVDELDPLRRAYLRYNTQDSPKRHVVEELDARWLRTTGRRATIFAKQTFPWYDGGGMFRVGDRYFVMLSSDCCFCQWGSDALVFVAPSPLGPWRPQRSARPLDLFARPSPPGVQPPANWTNEVNPCADGRNPPAVLEGPSLKNINPCSQANVKGTNYTVPAQQFSVACLHGSDGEPLHLYFGENFNSAPDGIKAHDLQAWLPLRVDASTGRLHPMAWLDAFEVDVGPK